MSILLCFQKEHNSLKDVFPFHNHISLLPLLLLFKCYISFFLIIRGFLYLGLQCI
jgi:hypothetical protein